MGQVKVTFDDGSTEIVSDEEARALSSGTPKVDLASTFGSQPIDYKSAKPSNLAPLLPVLAQAGAAAAGGALTGGNPLGIAGGAGLASTLIGILERRGQQPEKKGVGIDALLQGGTQDVAGASQTDVPRDPKIDALMDFLLGAGTEGGAQFAGAGQRVLSGKRGLLRGAEEAVMGEGTTKGAARVMRDAASAAAKEGAADVAKAEGKVLGAREEVNRLIAKHTGEAFETARGDLLNQKTAEEVSKALGVPSMAPRATLEELTSETTPILRSVQKHRSSIFEDVSLRFQDILGGDNAKIGMESQLASAVGEQLAYAKEFQKDISPGLKKIMDEGRALVGETGATNVGLISGVRDKLSKIVRKSTNPYDGRVANDLIEVIDGDLAGALPQESQAALREARDQWRQASSVFNDRSALAKVGSPEELAKMVVSDDPNRATLLINKMEKSAPDELPLLRSAVSEYLHQGDLLKNLGGMDRRVFKSLYHGTGFDTPEGWVDAIHGKLGIQQMLQDPRFVAKVQSTMKKGMESVGMKDAKTAQAEAERVFRLTPDPLARIQGALGNVPTIEEAAKAGGMAGMKEPILEGFTRYLQHKAQWKVAAAALGAGAYLTHDPLIVAVPLTWLAGSKFSSYLLSQPRKAEAYYKALTSKTAEQLGFWTGRLAASSLSEMARDSGSTTEE